MKKKNPGLRRNIKFDDRERTLVMDVRTEEGWKTIEYATARNILKNRPKKKNSLSGCDVENLLNKSDVVDSNGSDSDMDEDVTIIEDNEANKAKTKCSPKSISFVNTNARSLMPKVKSLGDSFDELELHFAQVTETWLQSNVDTDDLALRLRDGFCEFNGIEDNNIPTSYDSPIVVLSPKDVGTWLRKLKKTRSMVRGDMFPSIINDVASSIATPLASIFNAISSSLQWPNYWKTEFVTAIPKKPHPQNTNDLRNISCTPFFSKTYESFVLDWLGDQTSLRTNQFGGVKGCGTEHFLVEMWQKVLENLDDYRAASFLTSIDYSKAFNRLDFGRCLDALKHKGASSQLLGIIGSFLSGIMMTVKVGNSFSGPRPVLGGVPQGSKLGVVLFNSAIDSFEAFSDDVIDYGRNGLPPAQLGPPARDLPISPDPTTRNYRHMPPFATEPLQVLKYIDHNILHEKVNFENVPTDSYGFKNKHAKRSQNLVRRIVAEAETCGMKVNADKTQTMCISEVKSYNPSVFFYDRDGTKTKQSNQMKILGVTFSSYPDMAVQAKAVMAGLRARIWSLSHLAHHGLSEEDLFNVYKASIRPVHDYCSVVFSSSLTSTQSNALKRLQAKALKNIYGYEHSYSSLLQRTGITSLKVRRDNRVLKFARKAAENPRYAHWFPRNPNRSSARSGRNFLEFRAKTNRLFNSPLFDMRRSLNAAV